MSEVASVFSLPGSSSFCRNSRGNGEARSLCLLVLRDAGDGDGIPRLTLRQTCRLEPVEMAGRGLADREQRWSSWEKWERGCFNATSH